MKTLLLKRHVCNIRDLTPCCTAGLEHYQPLVTTMRANVDNYEQVASLPDFRLFAVFFIVPGVLLILLAGIGLYGERGAETYHHRVHPTLA